MYIINLVLGQVVFILLQDECYTWDPNWTRMTGVNYTRITSSKSTKPYYQPNPAYDVYWTAGHWIFGTSTTALGYQTTVYPRYLVCGKNCELAFSYLKTTCAHYRNPEWRGQSRWYKGRWYKYINLNGLGEQITIDPNRPLYQTFPSYCAFLGSQCHDSNYIFVHFGECLEDDDLYLPLNNNELIVKRKNKFLEEYEKNTNRSTDKNYNAPCHCYNMGYVDKTRLTGSCYYIPDLKRPWGHFDAGQANPCNEGAPGATLATIDDEAEHKVVLDMVADYMKTVKDVPTYEHIHVDWVKDGFRDDSYYYTHSREFWFYQINYAPWPKDRKRLHGTGMISIAINSTSGYYIEGWAYSTRGYALCEKRIPRRPDY